jgi:hypothetical protein
VRDIEAFGISIKKILSIEELNSRHLQMELSRVLE